MAWWPFGRRSTEDKDVDVLLAEAHAASRLRTDQHAAQVLAQPGDGSFRMPVEDVFMITGRGCVVTGHVEAGVAIVGMQVHLVRAGATTASTVVKGIEKFRATLDQATVGENVGILLDGLSRETVQAGDLLVG
jgi:translation elongation factor EF-Tu-like GTPase